MIMAVAALSCHPLAAQTTCGIEYTTELQTDFANLNHVNLLKLTFSQHICSKIRFDLRSISIAKTRSERLIDDLQTFSNIEEENLPFSLAVAGLTFSLGNSHLFAGIRNLNEDYFNSPVTSLFTNSSCGIFPTISANFPIANYPLSSLGIHYELDMESWKIQASVYNGRGYNGFTGGNSLFRFCPAADGLFGITSLNYQSHGSSYHFGGVLYHGFPAFQEQTEKKSISGALWGYIEQQLTPQLSLLAQYSAAFPSNMWCHLFGGLGLVMRFRKAEIGVFSDCAVFSGVKEFASELTGKITVSHHVNLQPAIHLIQGSYGFKSVALMRLNISL